MDRSEASAKTSEEVSAELVANVSQTVHALFLAGSVEATLQMVVDLAVTTIEGCDLAGIFLIESNEIVTPASTDAAVMEIDELQRDHREGPCLDAIEHGLTVYAEDLTTDSRWPRFAADANRAGIRGVLALPLPGNGTPGALNLYGNFPQAFGAIDRAKGQILSALADVALASARVHEDEQRRSENLQAATVTREVIGQAQGILIERERITPHQAFDILRRASQHLNLKLRDVAQALVETGERPETGPGPRP